jgi:hypothetical protein
LAAIQSPGNSFCLAIGDKNVWIIPKKVVFFVPLLALSATELAFLDFDGVLLKLVTDPNPEHEI